ncbi:MAG: hypothetical protein EBZ40_08195 [Gammaproteobacteria bacterium]|nr:hypothetical protein [Gammaproteobacteria bacterium]
MMWRRWLQNLLTTPIAARRRFPPHVLRDIEAAITEVERLHAGELRFVVETALDFAHLRGGMSARERAIEQFGQLRVWDTEHNNGVLIYVLFAERRVEIVADRGIAARVSAAEWAAVCRAVEVEFRDGRFREGSLAAIAGVGGLLAQHFPAAAGDRDEQPNRPLLL